MAVTKNEVAEMKNEQEKLEDFLKSELMKEGDEILAEIEADESLKDISLPEEMDEGLWKKMKKRQAEKAAYEALSEKDKEALRLGRELLMMNECGEDGDKDEKNAVVEHDAVDDGESGVENDSAKVVKYSKKRNRRVYLLIAAVAVLALAAGMTSIGGAPFVTGMMKKIIGNREMVQIDSKRDGEDESISSESEESKAWQEVEDQLGVEPVRFWYRPEGIKMIGYEINQELEDACLLYECDGKIIEYQLWANYRNKSIGYSIEDRLISEENIVVSGVEINIKEYQVEESGEYEYVARFKYENSYYIINSEIEKTEFINIVKNLDFL